VGGLCADQLAGVLTLLCRVPTIWHSTKAFIFLKKSFTECPRSGTWQRLLFFLNALPSVRDLALSKGFYFFFENSLPSAQDSALGKEFSRIYFKKNAFTTLIFFNFFAERQVPGTQQIIFVILFFLNYFAEC
jgi:hypothetical protein